MGEIPHLQAAVSRLKGKPFEILFVSLDDTREELTTFLGATKPPGVHTYDMNRGESPTAILYNVEYLPTKYLIDPKGVIVARDPDVETLAETVEKILGGRKNAVPKDKVSTNGG